MLIMECPDITHNTDINNNMKTVKSANTSMTSNLIILLFGLFEAVLAQSDYDVRLVGGLNRKGRVEIYYLGEWGTICDDKWGPLESQVVCRQLGYDGYAVSLVDKSDFVSGTGTIWLDDVSCTGSETSLSTCSHRPWGKHDCSHSEDVAVRCRRETYGSIRLAGGSTSNEGHIEMYRLGSWGTVCSRSWDISEGAVACRQLGYTGVEAVGVPLIPGTGQMLLDRIECSGREMTLDDCTQSTLGVKCEHADNTGIRCSVEPEGSLRLVDGPTENEGRVEIFHNGEWGTVCDDGWDMVDGEVACRQMGYPGAVGTYYGGKYGLGSGRIWLDDVQCIFGTEKTLLDCSHFTTPNCDHSEDAGLQCSPYIVEGTVRLRAGSSEMGGRLEIYYQEKWGTICDDGWDAMDSKVACKQLGYTGSSGHYRALDSPFTIEFSSETPIYLDTVECVGDEQTLDYCRHDGWGVHDCTHEEDIGVQCYLEGGGLPAGAMVGIIIGSLVVLFLVCMCCWICKKKKSPTQQHTAVPSSDVGAVPLDNIHGGTHVHPGGDAANLPPPSYDDIKGFKTPAYPTAPASYGHPPPAVPYQAPSAPYPVAPAPYPQGTAPFAQGTAPYPQPTAPIPPPSSSAVPYPHPAGDPRMVPSAPPAYPPANPNYPPTNPNYPPTNTNYPTTNPNNPPTNPGYPPANPNYPPTNPDYPPTNPDYPPTNPDYPPTNPEHPSTNCTNPPTNPSDPTTSPPTSTPI